MVLFVYGTSITCIRKNVVINRNQRGTATRGDCRSNNAAFRRMSRHHKICRSRGGNYADVNLVELEDKKHEALHTVFHNMLPHEQLAYLIKLNAEVLTAEFREKLLLLLTEDIYNPEAFHKGKLEKEQRKVNDYILDVLDELE